MPHPPLPTSVTRDLARLIESEALGVAFFATAAHLSVTEEERRAWRALRDLESRPTLASAASLSGPNYPAVHGIASLPPQVSLVGPDYDSCPSVPACR